MKKNILLIFLIFAFLSCGQEKKGDTNPSNMTRDGVDLSEAFEEDGSGAADTVIEQMNEATQGMTAQGFKQQGFERPLGT